MIYIVHYFDEGPIPPICFDEYNPSRCGVQLSNKKIIERGFMRKLMLSIGIQRESVSYSNISDQ